MAMNLENFFRKNYPTPDSINSGHFRDYDNFKENVDNYGLDNIQKEEFIKRIEYLRGKYLKKRMQIAPTEQLGFDFVEDIKDNKEYIDMFVKLQSLEREKLNGFNLSDLDNLYIECANIYNSHLDKGKNSTYIIKRAFIDILKQIQRIHTTHILDITIVNRIRHITKDTGAIIIKTGGEYQYRNEMDNLIEMTIRLKNMIYFHQDRFKKNATFLKAGGINSRRRTKAKRRTKGKRKTKAKKRTKAKRRTKGKKRSKAKRKTKM